MEQNSDSPDISQKVPSLKWLRIIAAGCLLLIIILAGLPFGIRYGIEQALMKNGAEHAVVKNVDFNPFTGTLVIHGLRIKKGETTTLNARELMARLSWMSLFRKRIYLKEISVQGTGVAVEQYADGTLQVGGLTLTSEEGETENNDSAWEFGIGSTDVSESSITFLSPDLDVKIGIHALEVRGLESWNPEKSAKLIFQGTINDGDLLVKTDITPFSQAPEIHGAVTLKNLSLSPLAKKISSPVSLNEGTLLIESEIDAKLNADSSIRVEHQGTVTLSGTEVQSEQAHIQSNSLTWTGSCDYTRENNANSIGLEGNVSVRDLSIDSPDRSVRLVELQQLELKKVNMNIADDIKVASVHFSQLMFGRHADNQKEKSAAAETPLFNASSMEIADIHLKDLNALTIQSIDIEDAGVYLRMNKSGQLHILEKILPVPGKEKTDGPAPSEKTVVKIGRVLIHGDSHFKFEDQSVTPPYQTTLDLDNVSVSNIDASKPEQKSPVELEGGIGKYTTVSVSGHIQPFDEEVTLDLAGKIGAFDLPELSSYTAIYLGYNFMSGHIDADISMKIEKGRMDGSNALVLKKLKLKPLGNKKTDQLNAQLTMPLDSALSLLRDKDGTIRIDLPIGGDIADPKFELGSIINKALGSAIKKAALTYLKISIQPFGALITIVEIAGKTTRVRLDPVFFAPASVEVNEESRTYLTQAAKLMQERPGINLSICGKTAPRDIDAIIEKTVGETVLTKPSRKEETDSAKPGEEKKPPPPVVTDEQKLSLAKDRASVIKEHLVQEHGIEADRLFICNPETDEAADARPRAELLI